MRERVLITGASGFLGYHIIQAAIDKGLDVFAAIRKNSNIKHLETLQIQYLFLDYDDVKDIARQLAENRIDYIIHAAGDTKALTQQAYDHVNATYTINLAKAAEKLESKLKKMVFISSLAAVGPLQDNNKEITEQTTPMPVTAYGRSKLLAEKNLAGIAIPTIILRPTAIYGPRDKNIFIVIKMINNGFDLHMGKIQQQLSFVHAEDVAELAVISLFTNATGIYNITDGNKYNRYRFAEIVKTILKKKVVRLHIPMPLVKLLASCLETINGLQKKTSVLNREKLNELAAKNWICDISKAKKELGFAPKFDLQSGLEESLAWYKKNNWL